MILSNFATWKKIAIKSIELKQIEKHTESERAREMGEYGDGVSKRVHVHPKKNVGKYEV